jgi:hydroxyethylthiazole kinase-like uncharacterized protein yjeF
MYKFSSEELKKLWKPRNDSGGEDNGQVMIIGGSHLFHGAPILALKAASRLVDMVFFSSPEETLSEVAAQIKAKLASFIWVPLAEADEYIGKSEAVLIGPGFLRFHSERVPYEKRMAECDEECQKTRKVTYELLKGFPDKKWVIDGGSLQSMDKGWIPKGAILTPNKKEFEILFGNGNEKIEADTVMEAARKFECVIDYKAPVSIVSDGKTTYEIEGGNAGLTKGGTGDVLAGLTVGLLAKNEPLLAAASASWIVKKTADKLFEKVGYNYNADDVAEAVGGVWKEIGS